jgi:prepilin-type N-terminal cleavage/methylation domain-containing protein
MFRITSGKKGFTFVELAIVLVIIGIIMGLAIKGRSLIRSAKMRNEIRKIEKLQTALMSYINIYQGVPPDYDNVSTTAPFSIDYNIFLEQDLIQMNDMLATLNTTNEIAGTSYTYPIWGYTMCGNNITDNYSFYGQDCEDNSRPGRSICTNICVAGMTLTNNGGSKTVSYSPVMMEMKCAIEAMADDRDYNNGSGRGSKTYNFDPTVLNFTGRPCSPEMNYTDFLPGEASSVGSTYVYRIY